MSAAAPVAAALAASSAAPLSAAGGLAQTALSLVLVLGAIFALAWVLRRVQGFRVAGSAALQVQGGLQVGPKERVLWIQAGGAHLLIGVAPGRVQTLHVFDQAPPALPVGPAGAGFSEALRKVMRGQTPP
ncbi:MAG: flagellar biosynthetic protein FliO [Nevskia sp.]|nr:flagellar biosynthetic protein FliO [Nevskia sp.]